MRWTFQRRPAYCAVCEAPQRPLGWTHEPLPPCPTCGGRLTEADDRPARAHAVVGDEIDRVIEHGLCHPDGSPRRFRSRRELRAAERAAGLRVLERGERLR